MKGGHFMLKMHIELDEERMIKDGIDLEVCKKEFLNILNDVPEMKYLGNGDFETEDFAYQSIFLYHLEDLKWFMKYVSIWTYEDVLGLGSFIEDYNEIGIKCCYE